MKKIILPAILLIALTGLISACTVYEDELVTPAANNTPEKVQSPFVAYTSLKYNLSFNYPSNYKAEETEMGLLIYSSTANPTSPRTNMTIKTKPIDEVIKEIKGGVDIKVKEEGTVILANGGSAKKLILTTTGGMLGEGTELLYYVIESPSGIAVFQGYVGDGTDEKIFQSVNFAKPAESVEKKPEEKPAEPSAEKPAENVPVADNAPAETPTPAEEAKTAEASVILTPVTPSLEVK